MAAQSLGYKVCVLDPGSRQPGGRGGRRPHRAPTTSTGPALAELAARCRAVTTEFENVPAAALEFLAAALQRQPGSRQRRDRAGPDRREALRRGVRPRRGAARGDRTRERPRRARPGAAARHPEVRAPRLRRQGAGTGGHGRRRARRLGAHGRRALRARAAPARLQLRGVGRRARAAATAPRPRSRSPRTSTAGGILAVSIVPARVRRRPRATRARGGRATLAGRTGLRRRAVRRVLRARRRASCW